MFTFTPEQKEIVDYIMKAVRKRNCSENIIVSGQGGVQLEKPK